MDSRYNDILPLPHHVSPCRRRMSNQERAAQFAPFAALTGYEDAIAEEARLTDQQTALGDWQQAELNETLNGLLARVQEHPFITVTYFQPDGRKQGGAYAAASGKLKKIDVSFRRLYLADGAAIGLDDIARIETE